MLPRRQRLSSRAFARAFENSRVLRHPLLQLRVHCRPEHDAEHDAEHNADKSQNESVRASFVVPKKLGKAAWRNRVRRRVRERYRLVQLSRRWPAGSGKHELQNGLLQKRDLPSYGLQNCDLIFLLNTQCATATAAQLDEAIVQLLQRASKAASPDKRSRFSSNVPPAPDERAP